ncbi:MAG: PaaI family thioesterase [Flavobacteriales bacterium]
MSIIEAYIEQNHFGKWLGMSFEILEPGVVAYRLQVLEKHLATPMHAHGGCIASLLDATLGVGALSLVSDEQKVVSTVDLSIQFLAGVKKSDQLFAYSKCLKKGNKLIFMQADVFNQHKELVAHANGTFSAVSAEVAGYSI